MTPAGLEPTIPGSVGRCLIHWATGPWLFERRSASWLLLSQPTERLYGLSACLLPIIGCLEISFPSSFLVLCFIDARSSSLVSSFNPLKIQAPIKQRAIMDEGKLSNRGPDMAEAREGKVISFAPSTSSTIRGTRYCSTL